MRQVEKWAKSRINDAVRLAFIDEGELGGLAELDLSPVTEFKRNNNGAVELKFIDRLAVLQWLMEQQEKAPKAEQFYEAIEKGAGKLQEGE